MASKALIIVDMQRDFMPLTKEVSRPVHGPNCNDYTGCQGDCGYETVVENVSPLPVADGLKIVPNIVKEAYSGYDLIVATRDFHPQNHMSFDNVGGEWPTHCVAGSEGAQLLPEIDMVADIIVSKGTDPTKEAYSGFQGTLLGDIINASEVKDLVIVGVATDFCVINTAFDATYWRDNVTVLIDCIAGVFPESSDDALIKMDEAGIELRQRG